MGMTRWEVSKKRFGLIAWNFTVWFVLVMVWIVNFNVTMPPDNWAGFVSIAALCLLIMQLIEMRILGINYKNYIFWYVTLQHLFYYGRVILYWLDLDKYISWHLFAHYPENIVFQAGIFALIFSQGIFLGLTINQKPKVNSKSQYQKKTKKYTPNALKFAGTCMTILAIPFLVRYVTATIAAQRTGTYVAMADNISGITFEFSQFFVTGFIVLICSSAFSKRKTQVLIGCYLVYGVMYMILAADRRQMVISFIVMFLCYIKTYDVKINPTKTVGIAILGVALLKLLSAISSVRGSGISAEAVLNQMGSASGNNLLVQTLGEFGGTFFTLVNAMSYYPSKLPYVMGRTYLAAFLGLIPGVFSRIFPDLFMAAGITANMKSIDGNPCGGSLGQDLYANFGPFGAVTVIVLGMLLASLSKEYENETEIDRSRYYIKFYVLLNCVRAGFYELTRTYVYSLVILHIFLCVYNHYMKQRHIVVNMRKE